MSQFCQSDSSPESSTDGSVTLSIAVPECGRLAYQLWNSFGIICFCANACKSWYFAVLIVQAIFVRIYSPVLLWLAAPTNIHRLVISFMGVPELYHSWLVLLKLQTLHFHPIYFAGWSYPHYCGGQVFQVCEVIMLQWYHFIWLAPSGCSKYILPLMWWIDSYVSLCKFNSTVHAVHFHVCMAAF